mmetsp:Transcript_8770/g.20075  ORF Transcript_8770/g.20075 Transcript_8770/m.20075 type:complete len:94 (+) Transcript_8770:182-463(+)
MPLGPGSRGATEDELGVRFEAVRRLSELDARTCKRCEKSAQEDLYIMRARKSERCDMCLRGHGPPAGRQLLHRRRRADAVRDVRRRDEADDLR